MNFEIYTKVILEIFAILLSVLIYFKIYHSILNFHEDTSNSF